MIALKEAKAMKELLAEESEIMMMRTEDMDEDQLAWWKETKADIMARKMLARQARAASVVGASTPRAIGVPVPNESKITTAEFLQLFGLSKIPTIKFFPDKIKKGQEKVEFLRELN
ncbi:hypothetical protein QYE76_060024 [Lolium multiflorum]|uniref:Uncharacterized protein n=1 Tax=Lolium multiflorum TaxID=4521 RepID=A0AAD8RZ16_LOLMU|nr:hypothetical protein QYE76_060024 [Lolium multiflorum]